MASSHYLKQCWLSILGVLRHSPESNFYNCSWTLICYLCSDNTILKLVPHFPGTNELTHWGWVTHICVIKLHIIDSDNGLLPGRHQAIFWTNAGILLIWPQGTNLNEMLIKIQTFQVKKMHLKMLSAKWRPFCLGLSELRWVQGEGLAKILAMSEVNSEEQKQSGSICGKR